MVKEIELVEFRNGKFGIRRSRVGGYEFLDLGDFGDDESINFHCARSNVKNYCQGDKEDVEEIFEDIEQKVYDDENPDNGTVVKQNRTEY